MAPLLLSIVIPTYNAERYIEDTLVSIVNQTFPDFEVVIADGGSSDRTLDIAKHWLGKRAKIFSESDNGAFDALNKGFENAGGDILCWLNADDVYLSRDVLETVARTCSRDTVPVIYSDFCTMNADGLLNKTHRSWQMYGHEHYYGANIFTGSLFFTKEAWASFRGFSAISPVAFEYGLIDHLFTEFSPKHVGMLAAALRIHEDTLTARYGTEMFSQIESLRGQYPRKQWTSHIVRLARLWATGRLGETVKNKFRDKHAGVHWKELYFGSRET